MATRRQLPAIRPSAQSVPDAVAHTIGAASMTARGRRRNRPNRRARHGDFLASRCRGVAGLAGGKAVAVDATDLGRREPAEGRRRLGRAAAGCVDRTGRRGRLRAATEQNPRTSAEPIPINERSWPLGEGSPLERRRERRLRPRSVGRRRGFRRRRRHPTAKMPSRPGDGKALEPRAIRSPPDRRARGREWFGAGERHGASSGRPTRPRVSTSSQYDVRFDAAKHRRSSTVRRPMTGP